MCKEKVLIVVGYEQTGHLLSTVLRQYDYETIVANGIADGFQAFIKNSRNIFVVITEYRIPQFADGVIFCKVIKKITPAKPVVLLSSSFEDLDGVKCLHPDAGFDYFAKKPLSSILVIPEIVGKFANQT
ncbi:MAG: hypothetical protein UR99_C0002G0041 [Candidatus Moranbacteria bacterium GW2011_GWD2_36_12]|nr:MAG: hypothetical protein UR99_C0002G0041 [Candidatus Moranbacteria bacterium GW2011_GWD2_36_12]KKQ07066.1 MAG: hypothetical protein US16_C0003G0041 [Candidatus Moranbacteria bacterium GW2011_GWE2_36_40]